MSRWDIAYHWSIRSLGIKAVGTLDCIRFCCGWINTQYCHGYARSTPNLSISDSHSHSPVDRVLSHCFASEGRLLSECILKLRAKGAYSPLLLPAEFIKIILLEFTLQMSFQDGLYFVSGVCGIFSNSIVFLIRGIAILSMKGSRILLLIPIVSHFLFYNCL